MRGVRLVVDAAGQKTGVIMDLKKNPELWEDFHDEAFARKRASEPREPLESVTRRLASRRRRGKLSLWGAPELSGIEKRSATQGPFTGSGLPDEIVASIRDSARRLGPCGGA
jgi:hypothetical protein